MVAQRPTNEPPARSSPTLFTSGGREVRNAVAHHILDANYGYSVIRAIQSLVPQILQSDHKDSQRAFASPIPLISTTAETSPIRARRSEIAIKGNLELCKTRF